MLLDQYNTLHTVLELEVRLATEEEEKKLLQVKLEEVREEVRKNKYFSVTSSCRVLASYSHRLGGAGRKVLATATGMCPFCAGT